MAYKPNEQRMGSGGRRLFDGGVATESTAGSMFRSFWSVIAGVLLSFAASKGIDADTANSVISGVGAALSYGISIYLSKRNKVNMRNGM
jgi:multidrug transporter EmrE-like cation transporter